MSKLIELQAKANELFETEFTWYVNQDPRGGQLAIGIDWESNGIVLVDLEHPDGAVIQDGGLMDIDTIYQEAN